MVEKILNFNKNDIQLENLEKQVIESNNARLMFLYLYFVNRDNIDYISNEILKTNNYRYIHFMLRTFIIKKYNTFIDFIILNNDDPRYLFNILYDVDYLDDYYRLKIINKIITLKNDNYIFKAIYYYFVVLNLFNEKLFSTIQFALKNKYSISLTEENYKSTFDSILYKKMEDPDGFSQNCYKGRKDYIPNIIVCHINNTYNSAINNFYNTDSEVSSHYVIRKDGHIKQVVSLDDSSWANGTSVSDSSDVYYKFATSKLINSVADNANYFTFSIEHESFDGSLTEEQFKSTIIVMKEIIKYLKDRYNYDFQIDRDHIISHSEINPIVRTKCPGNKFPFDKIIEELKTQKI